MQITEEFIKSIRNQEPVSGYTHDFYRYPARFSPLFARAAIKQLSRPGDTILDPFMGGGTTLVEATVAGRCAVGSDISSLAAFVASTKTTVLSNDDSRAIRSWAASLDGVLNLRNSAIREYEWIRSGYQRNIGSRSLWPIRKTLELALAHIDHLSNHRRKQFARCVLLRTAQWALDCRTEIPEVREVRQKLSALLEEMLAGAREYSQAVKNKEGVEVACLHRSTVGLETDVIWEKIPRPILIITSPPYPGVHVLYHRWQIQGRRETPAPFWIAGSLDGQGASFYTFGDRKQQRLASYFRQTEAAFRSLAQIAGRHTTIVQMVAFSDASWQLPKYLNVMNAVGLREIRYPNLSDARDGRIWRTVPNRKWYATQKGSIDASSEVVLFHKLAQPTR